MGGGLLRLCSAMRPLFCHESGASAWERLRAWRRIVLLLLLSAPLAIAAAVMLHQLLLWMLAVVALVSPSRRKIALRLIRALKWSTPFRPEDRSG